MGAALSPLVTTQWLADELGAADLKLVDASWHMPASGRDAAAEFIEAHIPGAVFFDIDAIADNGRDLPHMLASPDLFAERVGALGIRETDRIVVYDTLGLYSAARVWWNFRVMGAAQSFVLGGGLPKWRAEGRSLESGASAPSPARFSPSPMLGAAVSATDILAGLARNDAPRIVDVRAADRFNAEVDEPRPGLRRGHIPGSVNLPFTDLVDGGELRDTETLTRLFAAAGFDPQQPVITSCGSGVTAPILNLALAAAGYDQMRVYDGSWAEWGADEALPIA